MGDTTIEWTTKTWNPTRGCALVSPGCSSCYAMGQAHRFSGKGKPFEGLTKKRVSLGPVWTGDARFVPDMLALPFSWREPQRVFVNSMSDLFFEKFSNEEIAAVFGVMAALPRHAFQILTKRAKRMREWFEWIGAGHTLDNLAGFAEDKLYDSDARHLPRATTWPLPNVWLGVSAEDQQRADERIPELLRTPAAVRFVSYEPALGPIDFDAYIPPKLGACGKDAIGPCRHSLANSDAALDWVIVGGESGPRARPFDVAWARSVVEQCKAAGVAVFVKQFGAKPYSDPEPTGNFRTHNGSRQFEVKATRVALKDRKGGDMAEWPADLRVREYPKGATP